MTVVFLHPPGIYDFRKRVMFLGHLSEAVPSTSIFEMYPLGFISMASHLEKNGVKARIVNIALKMLNDENFDVEKLIKNTYAHAFCIDLHWIAHLHGAVEIAKICKKYHPDTPVVFGGFTSTYYHKEILRKFPVDCVLKGDSCEVPLLDLVENLDKKKECVPNLSWKENGRIRSNPITFVPEFIDSVIDPRFLLKLILRDMDPDACLPYASWLEEPTMPVLVSKGCLYNCINCGGSKNCYERIYNRKKPAFMKADSIIEQMLLNEKFINNPVFFLNDIRMGGKKYYRQVFERIKKEKIDLPVVFELFSPLTVEYAKDLKNTFAHYNLEISPDDASEEVRFNTGKFYTNADVEKTIGNALDHGCDKIDIFFMIGLGKQKKKNVYESMEYIDRILEEFESKRICPFVSPYAPTLDPGCIAFEDPERYGYVLLYKTIEEQYRAFDQPLWEKFFNYRTAYLTPHDITELTHDAAVMLAEIKNKHGLIRDEEVESVKRRAALSRELTKKLERIAEMGGRDRAFAFNALKSQIKDAEKSFIHKNTELNWPRSRKSLHMHMLRAFVAIARKIGGLRSGMQ